MKRFFVILFLTNLLFAKEVTVKLNSGYEMPVLGLGTSTLKGETCEKAVYAALKDGYRLIDTSPYYENEEFIGKAIFRAINEGFVKREEIFITTKIIPNASKSTKESIDGSLARLGVNYIDLMLINHRCGNDGEVYESLINFVKEGKIHSIGLSNYYEMEYISKFLTDYEIRPSVIQNENHIFYQNTTLMDNLKKYNVQLESYYPFGGRGHIRESLSNPTILRLSSKYSVTSNQILLRWQIQSGYIAIPGSSNAEHIAINHDIFNFKLSKEDMDKIALLNTNQRYEKW